MDAAGDEADPGAAGLPTSVRDLTDLSAAARDLDRRIDQHLARLRRERARRGEWPDEPGTIPGQRLRPGG